MIDGPPVTSRQAVSVTWTEDNGHMNEAAYPELGIRATDGLMRLVGADADYIASGKSTLLRCMNLPEIPQAAKLAITGEEPELTGENRRIDIWKTRDCAARSPGCSSSSPSDRI